MPPHSSRLCAAGLEHPHDVAVLVAEEGDGAHRLGLGLGRLVDAARGRCPRTSPLARSSIRLDLVGGDRRVVAEVEAQAVGRDQRARLLHVLAEHLAQRPVQDVGAGVVAADGVAPLGVDGRVRPPGPAASSPSLDAGDVAAQPGQGVGGVEHLGPAGRRRDRAGVADLAAATRRRTGCGRAKISTVRVRAVDGAPARRPARGRRPRRRCRRRTRWCRTARPARGSGRPGRRPRRRSCRASLARRRCSAISALKPADVDLDAALGGDLRGHLQREAVGVVELERRPRRAGPSRRSDRARPRGWRGRCAASGGSAPPRG